jgi:hypothetical protein
MDTNDELATRLERCFSAETTGVVSGMNYITPMQKT